MSTEDKKPAAETARAKARSEEPESEHEGNSARKWKTPAQRFRSTHHLRKKASDEANRLTHAFAYALAENLRSAADVIKVVADEAYKRNEERVSIDEGVNEMRLEFEDDVASVVNKGIEKTLDIPRRVLDKFYEVYHEPVHKQA
jgi:hypothetical protein